MLDYASNVAAYGTFQAYFRDYQPPLLAVWGKNDPFFIPPGAEAFRRDLPKADIRFFDTGHFALETHAAEIGAAIREFLGKRSRLNGPPRGERQGCPPWESRHSQQAGPHGTGPLTSSRKVSRHDSSR